MIPLPFLCMKNFDARLSEEVFPNEMFQNCETKDWRRIVSYPKKHFSMSKSFWSTRGFLYEKFRYCETSAERRNFSGESWYTWPSYARKISILKILWNTKGFPYEMRQYCEPKTLTRILMPTPFVVLNVFRYRKFSETQKGSLTKSFGTVKQNSFTENPDNPTPLMHEKFLNQIFSERMKASLRNVSIQRDKKILGQSWRPPTFFSLTFFQKIISETQKGSSTKCFGTVRWNHFDAQSWRPPLFLSLIFFDFKKIWNTERSLYEKFRYHEIKKIDGESWCVPTFFSLTFFDIKISETQNGSSTKWFATGKQTSKHSRDSPTLSFFNIFSIWKIIWNTEGFLDELFWYCGTK